MFEPLPAKFSFPESEQHMLELWKKYDVFARSLELRRDGPRFVFYEGPPTANGMPHPGHCLTRAIKDLFPRYKTMRGCLVERKAGWDTHGLPVEIEVCKQLGINSKEEIEAYGLDKFVKRCIQSVFRYVREWEEMTDRLGFWINLDEAYVTYHQSYVESVWWGLKTLFERDLLYQGHKVVWWWAQGGTALSAGEVGEGYRTVEDPSVYIRFPLVREAELASRANEEPRASARPVPSTENVTALKEPRASARPVPSTENITASEEPRGLKSTAPHERLDSSKRVSLLVWTTTPWTLISNHFAAVHPLYDYALVHDKTGDEYFYIATDLVEPIAEKIKHKFETVATCRGKDLLGLRYVPPFDSYHKTMADRTATLKDGGEAHIGWRVLPAEFVTLDTGSGIVHQAPAYGEVDFELLQNERNRFVNAEREIPLINAVGPDGTFTDEAPEQYRGRWVKDCDKEIMRELRERGVLLHQEVVKHEYPFCPRSENDPLIQYARKSWFVRTSRFKEEFLANNDGINWLPDHIKEGRFGDFLRNNVDWALSRERYWGTPLPIWVCEQTGKMEAIGSYAELLAKPGVQGTEVWEAAKKADPELPDHLKVHKPYIDAITYDSPYSDDEEPRASLATEEPRASLATEEPRASARPVLSTENVTASEEPGGLKSAALRPRMRRVPEVIDCWWDAGSMPFAQWGFPHVEGSVETFTERFPCHFISEAIDQTRGWFYGLLAISTLLFTKGGTGVSPVGPDPSKQGGTGVSPVGPDLRIRHRNLPHWEAGGGTYFVTFRTLESELSPDERTLVLNACRHWDGQRLTLHAAVVMPDHAHMLFTPLEAKPGQWWSLSELMHSIKSFTSHEIGKLRGSPGQVWQDESFDRVIRSADDFEEKLTYIINNPVNRGLGDDYEWGWMEPSHGHRRDPCATLEELPDHRRDACATLEELPDHRRDACATLEGLSGKPYPHPYKTCIVLGHVMGEDGLKMSKRTGNYKEPGYIFDHYGADAMRWYFFSAQTPWTSVRFQEAAIRDSQREFLVRLYNVFSFFNIYANIDGFGASDEATERRSDEGKTQPSNQREEPRASARPVQGNESAPAPGEPGGLNSAALQALQTLRGTGWRPAPERSQIDRWITSELHDTVKFVRDRMDNFENYPAAGRLKDFLDALSNWYVRRSRDRFWRPLSGSAGVSPADQDKWDAYNTLYEALVTLSKLVAPFTPFFAETMYQNLVRHEGTEARRHEGGVQSSALQNGVPLSVHLCDYPEADETLIDETLAQEMDLVRQVVSTGRAARTAAKLKVRQPLAQVEIILAWREYEDRLAAHTDLIAEELNVRKVEFTHEADHYVQYQIKPNFKALGPKFGKLAPKVAAALNGLEDAATARKAILEAGELTLTVKGQSVTLTKDEVEIRLEAREGWSASQGRAGVVVVSTELTPELREEGLVRELIHHVQNLRKKQELAYEARVTLYVTGPEEFTNIVGRFSDTIGSECLAERIELAAPRTGEVLEAKIEGHLVKLAIQTV